MKFLLVIALITIWALKTNILPIAAEPPDPAGGTDGTTWTNATRGQFPFVTAIYYPLNNLTCAGVLVGYRSVLTLAQCVHKRTPEKLVAGEIWIDLSGSKLTHAGQIRMYAKSTMHPKAISNGKVDPKYDLAVIRVRWPFIPTKNVLTISVAEKSLQESDEVSTAGFMSLTEELKQGLLRYQHATVVSKEVEGKTVFSLTPPDTTNELGHTGGPVTTRQPKYLLYGLRWEGEETRYMDIVPFKSWIEEVAEGASCTGKIYITFNLIFSVFILNKFIV